MISLWLSILLCLVGIIIGILARYFYGKVKLTSIEQEAIRVKEDAIREAEAKKNAILIEGRDQLYKEQKQNEKEERERLSELQRYERRLQQKEENQDKIRETLDSLKNKLQDKEAKLVTREEDLSHVEEKWEQELQKVAQMTSDEAKNVLIERMVNEAKKDSLALINKIEKEAQVKADKTARDIIVTTIQRIATEVSSELTVSSVDLPSDEMKGRIIGREGRNIRALETLTGADIIIDDTPEAVVISCFDPIRKEVARVSLDRLIQDGRIHPARIEEVVNKVSNEINKVAFEEGERVVFDLGFNNMTQETIRALGRLHYRTSYGQNVLSHSREVAIIAGMIASEVGADVQIARRGGLLHDIGKGIVSDTEANHAELGAELARKLGEDARVVNAIHSHHGDVEPNCIESVIVQVADAISASRPGARRESLDTYIKRLENLEEIAMSFEGVEKAFAVQAGRELRILVNSEKVTDEVVRDIAKGIAGRIETELRYPGRIRVVIIRETRAIEYAK